MLVDFTAKNFRSIRDEQILSFYAERNLSHLNTNIQYPSRDVGVLTSAAIYGANASGKSNVLKALYALCWVVKESHSFKENSKIQAFEPYRLTEHTKSAPTEFSIEFVLKGTRYLYQIKYDASAVIAEKLEFYSVSETRTVLAKLFERAENASWEDITFGNYYKGGTKRIALFKNQAYLSKAGNTPDAPQQIRDIYQYFVNGICFLMPNRFPLAPEWKKSLDAVSQVSAFLSSIDTGIAKLLIRHEEKNELQKRLPQDMPESIRAKIMDDISHVPYFEHETEEGNFELFAEDDESDGTRMLLNTLPLIFSVMRSGSVLIWDELETSLHPHVAELILDLFNDQEVNQRHAQLIFTTHNLALMNSENMRKDQLWLTEKSSGATVLMSMDEFDSSQLKSNSPFAKWYYEGRLGGLPAINYLQVKDILLTAMDSGAEHGTAT